MRDAPLATLALAAIVLGVAHFVTGFVPTEASLQPVAWSREAWAAGDWARLVASTFAHGGPVHLVVNLLALLSFGPAVERALGRVGFLVVYVTSGVAGNLAHALLGPDVPVVGASGAIFGLLGVLLVMAPLAEVALLGVLPMPLLVASALYVASVPSLAALSDVLPIAHEAHLGGMALGFTAGAVVDPWRAARVLPGAAAVFAAAWFGVAHALRLDVQEVLAADALAAARLLAPVALAVVVAVGALAYLARVDAATRRPGGA